MDRWSQRVIGAAMAVHSELGPGLLEGLYELCMREELKRAGIPFETQKRVPIRYRGFELDREVRIDLIVGSELVVELKSVEALAPVHTAQLLGYLKLSGCPVGLLINFNVPRLKHGLRRFVHRAPA